VTGCTDPAANNHASAATDDDGSCDYDLDDDGVLDADEVTGCTDPAANNHASAATDDDGSCDYDLDDDGVLDADEVTGCTSPVALNHNSSATDDDGSCVTISQLDAGAFHTCAIDDGGSVWCWGANDGAQLGDGTSGGNPWSTEGSRLTPAPVNGLGEGRSAVAISAGRIHTCAILDDGSVSCWGSARLTGHGLDCRESECVDDDGNGYPDPLTPTQTAPFGGGRSAVAIAAGWWHTCVILDDGSVSCWGDSTPSAVTIGDGTGEGRYSPTQTASLGEGRTAVEISAGRQHTCAILDDGSVVCWGANPWGALGDGSAESRYSPTQTASLGEGRTAVAISAGYHTCAILDDGSVVCWGGNDRGAIGTEYVYDYCVENDEGYFACWDDGWDWENPTHDCVENDDGDWECWTSGQFGLSLRFPTQTASLGEGRTAVAIANTDFYTTCVILDDGSVSCWGWNGHGQIGNGVWGGDGACTQPSYSGECNEFAPTQTASLGEGRTAVSIVAGESHFFVLLDDGSYRSWGRNVNGQLGDGSSTDSNVPLAPW
jgi:alpha-tubulin suppressor-like RCC1 family protein